MAKGEDEIEDFRGNIFLFYFEELRLLDIIIYFILIISEITVN